MKGILPMRITLDIPDEIYARLEARAQEEATTIQAIILRAIDTVLKNDAPPAPLEPNRRFKPPVIHSKRPGTLKLGEEGVYEYIDFP
jgi:hypothetical protein